MYELSTQGAVERQEDVEGHCPHTGVGVCCQKMASNPSEQGWVFIGKLKNSPLASEVSHNSQDLVNPDNLHLRNCVGGEILAIP